MPKSSENEMNNPNIEGKLDHATVDEVDINVREATWEIGRK